MYAVILAGGGGTRLWPLSRPDRPKPFLPLLGDQSLLRATYERVVPALALSLHSTNAELVRLLAQRLEIPRRAVDVVRGVHSRTKTVRVAGVVDLRRLRP